MHIVFYEVFYFRQTIILSCKVLERDDIIETTAAHFLKKVWWLSQNCFSTNYTEHNMNLKVKEA